jgi:hypothetical protein
MTDADQRSPQPRGKRNYLPPKLETLGTIRDLTQGLGTTEDNDGGHPPGHNKSRVNNAKK